MSQRKQYGALASLSHLLGRVASHHRSSREEYHWRSVCSMINQDVYKFYTDALAGHENYGGVALV